MRQVYQLTDKIREIVDDELVLTVEVGNVDTLLNDDRTAFPAVLVDYGPATINNEECRMQLQCIVVDRPSQDNAENALNSTFAIASRIVARLQETSPDASYELERDVQAAYIWDEGTEGYAGWGLTLNIAFKNTSHE